MSLAPPEKSTCRCFLTHQLPVTAPPSPAVERWIRQTPGTSQVWDKCSFGNNQYFSSTQIHIFLVDVSVHQHPPHDCVHAFTLLWCCREPLMMHTDCVFQVLQSQLGLVIMSFSPGPWSQQYRLRYHCSQVSLQHLQSEVLKSVHLNPITLNMLKNMLKVVQSFSFVVFQL